MWLLHFLPLGMLAAVGRGVGLLLYFVAPGRRRVADTNLRLCFPSWSDVQRSRVVRAHFQSLARSFLERGLALAGRPAPADDLARAPFRGP
jgi:KDO2-lipid IV(A) lauroyltransferase